MNWTITDPRRRRRRDGPWIAEVLEPSPLVEHVRPFRTPTRREVANPVVPLGALLVLALSAACAPSVAEPPDNAPWKTGSGVTITAAPDAGGALSYRNCPTLDEARAAVPTVVSGPASDAVPFKTMRLQCSYLVPGRDVEGHPAAIGVLVFDASAEGAGLWDSVRSDPHFTNATDVPGLGDRAFSTGSPGRHDLWVVSGDYGLHIGHTDPAGLPLDQMADLARATLIGLQRPPR